MVTGVPGTAQSEGTTFTVGSSGGSGVLFSRRLGVRLLEADYIRTELPNSYSNTQNDLRLAVGLSYHLGSVSSLR
jgi:hypothetical protein